MAGHLFTAEEHIVGAPKATQCTIQRATTVSATLRVITLKLYSRVHYVQNSKASTVSTRENKPCMMSHFLAITSALDYGLI